MSDKLILFVLLAGFIYLPTIFPEELTDEETENMSKKFYTRHYEQCKQYISNETYQMVLDGADINNEETHLYALCSFKKWGFIVGLKIIITKIFDDLSYFIGRRLSLSESIAVKSFLKICEKEAESCTTEMDVMLTFGQCFSERFQSDM